jgi:hypothetical protein
VGSRTAGALIAVLLLAACGGDDDDDEAATTTTTTTALTTTTTSAPDAATVEWRDPEPVDVDEWHLESCEGDAPLTCVERDGEPVGFVELLDFPLASFADLEEPLADGDEEAAYEALAAGFLRDMEADRAEGCDAGYEVEPLPVEHLAIGDGTAVKYGFAATTADGTAAERAVQYAAIRGDTLVLLGANAYSPEGCIGTEGGEFLPEVLADFEPVLDQLVVASGLPAP